MRNMIQSSAIFLLTVVLACAASAASLQLSQALTPTFRQHIEFFSNTYSSSYSMFSYI